MRRMTKCGTILLALALMTVLPLRGATAADNNRGRVEFNLGGTYETRLPDSSWMVEDASIHLTGNYKEKGNAIYVSPLNGKLTIDGTEYNILVKPEKLSEPLAHVVFEASSQQWWYIVVEVNVEGEKYHGTIFLWEALDDPDDRGSLLAFIGIVDGLYRLCELEGDFPKTE